MYSQKKEALEHNIMTWHLSSEKLKYIIQMLGNIFSNNTPAFATKNLVVYDNHFFQDSKFYSKIEPRASVTLIKKKKQQDNLT